MRNLMIRFFITFFALLHFWIGNSEAASGFRTYEQLKDLSLDPQRIAVTEDILIKKDVATFHLKTGNIYLLQSIEDNITGAIFIGDGVLSFTPPTEIEKYQLKRFTGTETLNVGFNALYLRFTNETAGKLMSEIEFVPGEVPSTAKRIKNSSEDRIKDLLKMNINTRILADLLADSAEGFFYAEINPTDYRRLFFLYDPKEVEEVSLIQQAPKGAFQKVDLVCSFHKQDDYEIGLPPDEYKDEVKVNHYDMDIQINPKWDMNSKVQLEIGALRSGFRVLNFNLSDELKISTVLNEVGDSLEFVQEKDMYEISVILPEAMQKGEIKKLKFFYSGDILDRNFYGDFYIKTAAYWYPRYGYWTRSTFDLNFTTPKGFEFVTIGKREKKKKGKGLSDYTLEGGISSSSSIF